MVNDEIAKMLNIESPEVLNERMGDIWTDDCGKAWVPFNYEAQICSQIKDKQLRIYIDEITITDFDADNVEFEFRGVAYLGNNQIWTDGNGGLSFSMTDNYLKIVCDYINIDTGRVELVNVLGTKMASVSLKNNQLKVDPFGTNYGSDDSGLGPWYYNTPIEKEVKKAISDFQTVKEKPFGIDIKEYIDKIWEIEWEEI